jgi:hypothetical protein
MKVGEKARLGPARQRKRRVLGRNMKKYESGRREAGGETIGMGK